MQRYELDAWLGDNQGGLAEDQITDLLRAANDIGARYPDPDDADDRELALTVAYRLMVEPAEDVITELSTDLTRVRLSHHQIMVAIRQAALCLVEPAARKGSGVTSAQGFAARAGVDRQSVLSWLGRKRTA
jgi:hypothetical protein